MACRLSENRGRGVVTSYFPPCPVSHKSREMLRATGCLRCDEFRLIALSCQNVPMGPKAAGGAFPCQRLPVSECWACAAALPPSLSPGLLLTKDKGWVRTPVDRNSNSSAWQGWDKAEDGPPASLSTRPAKARLRSWATNVPVHPPALLGSNQHPEQGLHLSPPIQLTKAAAFTGACVCKGEGALGREGGRARICPLHSSTAPWKGSLRAVGPVLTQDKRGRS